MTDVDELAGFLRAQYALDASAARAADALGQLADVITTSSCEEFAEHIARWHPARVMAESSARLTEVRLLRDLALEGVGQAYWTLCRMAAPFESRPDFREEWRV